MISHVCQHLCSRCHSKVLTPKFTSWGDATFYLKYQVINHLEGSDIIQVILLYKHDFIRVSIIFLICLFLRSKLSKDDGIRPDDHMLKRPSKRLMRYLPHQPNYFCQRITVHVFRVILLTLITVCSSKACSTLTEIAISSSPTCCPIQTWVWKTRRCWACYCKVIKTRQFLSGIKVKQTTTRDEGISYNCVLA